MPPTVVKTVKSSRLQYTGHIALRRKQGINTEFWWGNLAKGHLERREGGSRITLKWILGKDVRMEGECNWLRIVSNGGRTSM